MSRRREETTNTNGIEAMSRAASSSAGSTAWLGFLTNRRWRASAFTSSALSSFCRRDAGGTPRVGLPARAAARAAAASPPAAEACIAVCMAHRVAPEPRIAIDAGGRTPTSRGATGSAVKGLQDSSSGRSLYCSSASGLASASLFLTGRLCTTSRTASSTILPLLVRGMSSTWTILAGT